MRRLPFLLIAALCVLTAPSIVAQSPPLTPFRGLIDHVSVDQWGGAYQNVEIWRRAISGDGRYVVMSSQHSYLATDDYDDWNGLDDIFLRDRTTGTTTRISRSSDGSTGNGISQMGTISTNGRHVAFASGSTNLVPGDTNDRWDVFVRDLDQQSTVRVSVATDGTQGDRDAYYPSLSADGRFVAFVSWATTFAPGVSSSAPRQMYLHDRDADGDGVFDEPGGVTTELVSVGFTGGIADEPVDSPRVSSDGRHVLFESAATNLSDVGNPNASNHLYLRDRLTGQTAFIDRAMSGGPSSWGVGYGTSDMTDDGRFITFSSISPDIVWFDMNWQSQVFLYDTVAGPTATTIVSRLPDGTVGDGSSYASSVSADGRYVVFTTAASNLASPPPGASGPAMLAVTDMLDGSFTRVDVLDSGEPFDLTDYYYTAAVSADGTAIVLQTQSGNAVDGPSGISHVVVVTALTAEPASASYSTAGGSGSIEVNTTAVSGWTAWSPWPWIVITEGGGFGAGPRTVQYFVDSNSGGAPRDGWIKVGSKYITIHQDGDGDATPPVITPTVTGTQVNGWYTSDITVAWSVNDPDSEIVSQSGCLSTTFTTDFLLAQPFCQATSHGGTSSVSVPLKRDTTGPNITITTPATTTYAAGSTVTPSFSCTDTHSGTATCTISAGLSPLNTIPGWHTFTVNATDLAGNSSTKSVEYLVGTGVCVTPNDSLSAWFRFEDDAMDALGRISGVPRPLEQTMVFEQGLAGRSWQAQPQTSSYIEAWGDPFLLVPWPSGLTVAAWVRPTGALGESATIVSMPAYYRIARYPDGTLRWAFSHTTGYNWVNTGVVIPLSIWSHVAVTYDAGLVKSYVNGRLVHTHQLSGTLTNTGDWSAFMTIGGRADVTASYFGWLDELQVYKSPLSAAGIDALAQAGNGSTCLPQSTTLSVSVPATVAPGPTFPAMATLRDGDGDPIANKWVNLFSYVSPGGAFAGNIAAQTDTNGQVSLNLPIAPAATPGTYPNGLTAYWDGDAHYTPSWAVADVTVKVMPVVTWNTPASIGQGVPLSGVQLNATASVPGTFVYTPASGTVLPTGTHTLSTLFTPQDSTTYAAVTKTVTLKVKAVPVITWATPAAITYPASITGTQLNATASVPGSFVYSPPFGTLLDAGTRTLSVTFTPSNLNDYVVTTKTVTLEVLKGTLTINWPSFDPIIYGTPLSATQLNATAPASGTMTYSPPAGTVLAAGTHTLTANFTSNPPNYHPATATRSLLVGKAYPPVWWPGGGGGNGDLTPINYGTPLGESQLNAYSTVAGSVTYNYPAGTVLNAGTHVISMTFTPEDTANYHTRTFHKDLLVRKLPTTVTWNTPASIVYGTVLSGTQLNATASVPGTFSYSPAAGTILNGGNHSLYVSFTPTDSVNYETSNKYIGLVVEKRTPVITWNNPAPIVYGTPLGWSQYNYTIDVGGGSFLVSHPHGTILNAGAAQTLTVTWGPDFSQISNYNVVSKSVTIDVLKLTPVINWLPATGITYGTPLGAAQLNATSSLPGTLTYTPPAGTVLPAGVNTVTGTFTPTDTVNHDGAVVTRQVTVLKATAVLSWSTPAPIPYGTPVSSTQLNATANVPGTFMYTMTNGAVLNAGSYSVNAYFTADDQANYSPGPEVTAVIEVLPVAPVITWAAPAPIVYGTALTEAQLNATANVPGTFTYSQPAGSVLAAGTHTVTAAFTPQSANYTSANATVEIVVGKAAPIVTWANPSPLTYGAALGSAQLAATANVDGTFAYSPSAGSVLAAGTHQLTVTFTPNDAANYNGASANVSLTVTKAAATINWANPANIVHGTALGAAQLNATANVAGTFSYSPAAGTVLGAGSHTLAVTFTPDDAANYNGASANVSLTVTRAATTINWSNPANIIYGTALGVSQLNATASVPGTFSYSPASGAVLNAGSHTLSVTFTPDDAANHNGASANVSLTVNTAASTISWSNPANIIYGTALGGSQLNATANVAGSFSYSAAAGTVLGAGSYTLVATFTPADAGNYNGSSASRSLTVIRAPLTITANNATKVYGAPLPAFSGTGSGFVNGDSMASLAGTLGFTTTATASSAVGGYPITPNGVASANYTIAFANGTLTVVRASTATAVAASPNPDGLNQAVTFTAVISVVAPGAGAPTGMVQFFDGTTLLGSATVVSGSASLTTNGLAAGNHSISATYTGDASLEPSSGSGSLTVKTAAQSSTTAVTSSANPSNLGQNVTLTATVTAPAGLSGSVAFYDGSTLMATRTLSGTTATFTTNALVNGGHAITARYLGNATIPPSTSPAFAQYVKPSGTTTRSSTTALAASPSPAALGSNVTLTATVTGSNNRIPSGQVLFMVNGAIVGQGTLTPIGGLNARTTFSISTVPRGTHKVEAVYLGDAVVRASARLVTLVVN